MLFFPQNVLAFETCNSSLEFVHILVCVYMLQVVCKHMYVGFEGRVRPQGIRSPILSLTLLEKLFQGPGTLECGISRHCIRLSGL